jgi:hypothetical protein
MLGCVCVCVCRTERLRGALTCYAIQNVCIAVSAAAAAALVLLNVASKGAPQHPVQPTTVFKALYWSLTCIMLLAGASSSIGSLGAAVAVEREYAKTLCGDDSSALRKLNASELPSVQRHICNGHAHVCVTCVMVAAAAGQCPELPEVPVCACHISPVTFTVELPVHAAQSFTLCLTPDMCQTPVRLVVPLPCPPPALRAIDLLSQMLGPVVSGLLMSYSSLFTAVVVLALYSLGAWLPEALLLQAAHRHSPRLR